MPTVGCVVMISVEKKNTNRTPVQLANNIIVTVHM